MNHHEAEPPRILQYRLGTTVGTGTFGVVKRAFDVETQRAYACKIVDSEKNPYRLGKALGSGAFVVVRRAFDAETDRSWACKVIEIARTRSRGSTAADVEAELQFLRRLDHPYVIRLRDSYTADGKLHIVTGLLRGGDLLTALNYRGSYTEEDARAVFVRLMKALIHVHGAGIVHRDIKLENLVLEDPDDCTSVVLVDFGLAADVRGPLTDVCGSRHYVAPEVIRGSRGERYDTQCDVWGAGVVLFILLAGYPPFRSSTANGVLRKAYNGLVDFEDPVWHMLSEGAADLVKKLLVVDPRKRLTPRNALAHPWVNGTSAIN